MSDCGMVLVTVESVEEIVLLLGEMDVELDGIRNALVISLAHESTFVKI